MRRSRETSDCSALAGSAGASSGQSASISARAGTAPADVDGQPAEQRAQPLARHVDDPFAVAHLERAEVADLHVPESVSR